MCDDYEGIQAVISELDCCDILKSALLRALARHESEQTRLEAANIDRADEFDCLPASFDWENDQQTFQAVQNTSLPLLGQIVSPALHLPPVTAVPNTFLGSKTRPLASSFVQVSSAVKDSFSGRSFAQSAVFEAGSYSFARVQTPQIIGSKQQEKQSFAKRPEQELTSQNMCQSNDDCREALEDAKLFPTGKCILSNYTVSSIDFRSSNVLVRHCDMHELEANVEDFTAVVNAEEADTCLAVHGSSEKMTEKIQIQNEDWERFLQKTRHIRITGAVGAEMVSQILKNLSSNFRTSLFFMPSSTLLCSSSDVMGYLPPGLTSLRIDCTKLQNSNFCTDVWAVVSFCDQQQLQFLEMHTKYFPYADSFIPLLKKLDEIMKRGSCANIFTTHPADNDAVQILTRAGFQGWMHISVNGKNYRRFKLSKVAVSLAAP